MKRRLLLTGPIGCGKSTLIANALGSAVKHAGGFLTLRVVERGRLAGFALAPACGGPRERFLSFGEGGAVRDARPFTVTAPALLKEAAKKKYALLDEIGGFELLYPDFYEALTRFFFSGTPCVGVLKAMPSAEELRRRVDLPAEYMEAAAELHELLESDPDTLVLETTGRYDFNAEGALRHWAEEYAI